MLWEEGRPKGKQGGLLALSDARCCSVEISKVDSRIFMTYMYSIDQRGRATLSDVAGCGSKSQEL